MKPLRFNMKPGLEISVYIRSNTYNVVFKQGFTGLDLASEVHRICRLRSLLVPVEYEYAGHVVCPVVFVLM